MKLCRIVQIEPHVEVYLRFFGNKSDKLVVAVRDPFLMRSDYVTYNVEEEIEAEIERLRNGDESKEYIYQVL